MTPTLATVLDGLFDYAGLFPPAALPMEEAFQEYVRHVGNPDEAWVVDCFVCPVAWLPELLKLPARRTEPIDVTVLGTSIEGLRQDERGVEAFLEAAAGRFSVASYEVKIGPTVPDVGALRKLGRSELFELVYLEVPWSEAMEDSLVAIAECDQDRLCAKARTGGLEPAAFPSSDALAAFLKACNDLDLAYKLTAGLHHPIRRFDDGLQAWMHGFLNVAAAGALGFEHDLTRSEMATILEITEREALSFGETTLRVGSWEIGVDGLDDYRGLFLAIGSCSIREPLDDLDALGLL